MAFERAPFGDGTTNVTSNVSQHFGPRDEDSPEGVVKTEGGMNELVIDFDTARPTYQEVTLPAGAVVWSLDTTFATGSVTAATVGAIDISGANGTVANQVTITATGEITVTGPTAGKVVVNYRNYAG